MVNIPPIQTETQGRPMTQAEQITTMAKEISEMHGEFKVLVAAVKRHDKTLYGAERPGVVETLQAVEQRQRSCPALQAALTDPDTKAGRTANRLAVVSIVIFAVLNVATLAVAIYALST